MHSHEVEKAQLGMCRHEYVVEFLKVYINIKNLSHRTMNVTNGSQRAFCGTLVCVSASPDCTGAVKQVLLLFTQHCTCDFVGDSVGN